MSTAWPKHVIRHERDQRIVLNLRSTALNASRPEIDHDSAEPAGRSSGQRTTTALLLIWCIAIIFLWISYVFSSIHLYGLFGKVGGDYESFWAAGRAFIHSGPSSVYNIDTIDHFEAAFSRFHGVNGGPIEVPPGLYPPPYYLTVVPFALLSPVVSFVIWTAVQVLIAGYVVIRLVKRFSNPSPVLAIALILFFPIPFSLFYGQATILLMFAVLQAYDAFERGDEGRAGMWLAVLFLKPQYAIAFPLILLYKRRWRAFAGLTAIAAAIGVTSLFMMGIGGIRNYLDLSHLYTGFHNRHPTVRPEHMMNWHSVLINLFPNLPDGTGTALTWLMALLSFAALPFLWRGEWNPRSVRFAEQMLVSMIIVLMASFHSHIHGAVLLLVPGCVIMANGCRSRALRLSIQSGLIGIPILHFGLLIALSRDSYKIVVPLAGVVLCLVASASVLIRGVTQSADVNQPVSTPQLEQAVPPQGSLAA